MATDKKELDENDLAAIELEDRIGAEQVRSAYENTPIEMSATALAAMVVAGILAACGVVTWTLAIVCGAFMLVQIHARMLLIMTYLRRQPPDHEWRVWSRRFAVGAAVAGLGLGVFAALLMPSGHWPLQFMVVAFICAAASGAAAAFGVLSPAFQLSSLPMVLIPAAGLIARGWHLEGAWALVMAGWLAPLVWLARRHSARFQQTVRRRFTDEMLIARRLGENGGPGAMLDRNQAFQ